MNGSSQSRGWKFGEDEDDYLDSPIAFTNIHFYHPEWYGNEDENGNDFPISDPKVLSDIQSSILVALQEQEDDDGAEMKNIIEVTC